MRRVMALVFAATALAAAPAEDAVQTPEQAIAAAEKACDSKGGWKAELRGDAWEMTKADPLGTLSVNIDKHTGSDDGCIVFVIARQKHH